MNDKSAILLLEMLVMTAPFRKRLLLKKHIRSLKEAVTQEAHIAETYNITVNPYKQRAHDM